MKRVKDRENGVRKAKINRWSIGRSNATDLFQATVKEAEHYLGEWHEQLAAHLHRYIQALPHVQHAGKSTRHVM